ncbi:MULTISPECIES: hypothetical protein [unclassified Pseudofrankia]|uniref:hypothetical protein n=1 Tax=unclassified Pseudofrankia TaxID=2994372 RepID=UPI0008DB0FEE|nr:MULTISPECIES: hypothetical protein [unclassified Pseudofrankia]MDT3440929.1 hypothetical protein [Pseudofrankia sp. BMG5.37]OHV45300.1 hypothetical protein BCD48_22865 [Pseudofrankia sp. BMG5.36]
MTLKKCPRPEKQAYPTEQAALRHRNDLRFRRDGSSDLVAYLCVCGLWHVGHSQQRLDARISAALRGKRSMPGAKRKAW